MSKKKTTLGRTPRDTEQAVAEAERELQRPPDGKTQQVLIVPAQITTHPMLFQPRSFYNSGAVDVANVNKLKRRIDTQGELEPPLVVKLNMSWVCVDGHHRIAAYLKTKTYKQGNQETITCNWFPGTIQEAIDESVRRNDID